MGNQAGIIIRNVKNELFHSAKRLILNEVKGIECLQSEKEPFVQSDSIQPASPSPVRIMIELRMSNGLHLSQRNLNYQDLVRLVEKLEGLC